MGRVGTKKDHEGRGAGFGVSLGFFPGLAREAVLAKVAAAGFREVELPSTADVLENWLAAPLATRRAVEAAGLRVRSVHTPPEGWLNAEPDEAVRQGSVRAACACLRPAAELGAETIIWHANYHETPVPAGGLSASRELSRRSLGAFAERAGALGLRVAVENTPELGHPRPCTTMADVLETIAGFGNHVGVCLDAGHSRSNFQDPAAEARAAGPRLYAVHLQDNQGAGGDEHLVPGRDMEGWDRLVRTLDELGYSGGRMFEIHAEESGGDPDVTLKRLAELVRRWSAL